MNLKKIAIFSLVVTMFFFQFPAIFPTNRMVSAQDKIEKKTKFEEYIEQYSNCVQELKKWKKVDGKYTYPITQYDKEWGDYPTVEEKYALCYIPKKILNTITTQELLELVLDCPLIIYIYAQDTYEDGIKDVSLQFNGLHEFLNRSDCKKVVMNYYKNYTIPSKQKVNYSTLLAKGKKNYDDILSDDMLMKKIDSDTKVNLIIDFCETVLGMQLSNKIEQNMNFEDAVNIIASKNNMKSKSDYFKGYTLKDNACVHSLITNTNGNISNKKMKIITQKFGLKMKGGEGYFYTRGGKKVEYTTVNAKKISDSTAYSMVKKFVNKYRDTKTGKDVVTLLSNGTTAYNCFNYAWLYYDSKNKDKYWKKCRINNVSPYLNDNHYASSNSASPYYKIASNGAHAAVVCSTSVSYYDSKGQLKTEPLVKSKWSANGPLVKHPLSLCPYSPSGVKYYC